MLIRLDPTTESSQGRWLNTDFVADISVVNEGSVEEPEWQVRVTWAGSPTSYTTVPIIDTGSDESAAQDAALRIAQAIGFT